MQVVQFKKINQYKNIQYIIVGFVNILNMYFVLSVNQPFILRDGVNYIACNFSSKLEYPWHQNAY